MECFLQYLYGRGAGFRCETATEVRFHPTEQRWIHLCSKCAPIWDEEVADLQKEITEENLMEPIAEDVGFAQDVGMEPWKP